MKFREPYYPNIFLCSPYPKHHLDVHTFLNHIFMFTITKYASKNMILNLRMPNVGSHVFEAATFLAFNLMVTKHCLSDLRCDGGWNKYSVLDVGMASCIILRLVRVQIFTFTFKGCNSKCMKWNFVFEISQLTSIKTKFLLIVTNNAEIKL